MFINSRKIDDDFVDEFCKYLRIGSSLETVMKLMSVTREAIASWRKIAKSDQDHPRKDLYKRFFAGIDKAEAECVAKAHVTLDKSITGRKPQYEKYPKGTFDENGNPLEGRLVLDGKGNPIIKTYGLKPDWKAATWRIEKLEKKYKQTGITGFQVSANSESGSDAVSDLSFKVEFVNPEKREEENESA